MQFLTRERFPPTALCISNGYAKTIGVSAFLLLDPPWCMRIAENVLLLKQCNKEMCVFFGFDFFPESLFQ